MVVVLCDFDLCVLCTCTVLYHFLKVTLLLRILTYMSHGAAASRPTKIKHNGEGSKGGHVLGKDVQNKI